MSCKKEDKRLKFWRSIENQYIGLLLFKGDGCVGVSPLYIPRKFNRTKGSVEVAARRERLIQKKRDKIFIYHDHLV